MDDFLDRASSNPRPHPGCSIGKNAINPSGSALEGDDQENTEAQGRVLIEAVVEPQPETTYCADIRAT
ncbi:hypothetical protein [Bradyrhizobium sp. WSM1417]|uniref:hypothetical protein n=1 Tax=Bradyrhizobium sp. WSM1417 TaxID=754500 RepID=UPI0012EB7510|nr:hypothetical protein [Bradyrhizobium sp. WSM1417]